MRKIIARLGYLAGLMVLTALGAHGQVTGVQPNPLPLYYWNSSTSAWTPCLTTSTVQPYPVSPGANAFYALNASLGQWTPVTQCPLSSGNSAQNQINVMSAPYSAACSASINGQTGVLTTPVDDYAAINAAITAAEAIGTNATLYFPPGVICATSQTINAPVNVYGAGATIVPYNNADIQVWRSGVAGCNYNYPLAIGTCEPTIGLTQYLPNIYRYKGTAGWSSSTHPGVEYASVYSANIFPGTITNFQTCELLDDYGTVTNALGNSYNLFSGGWDQNCQVGRDLEGLSNQAFVNNSTWVGGRISINSSELQYSPFYGGLINIATWQTSGGSLPNVVTGVNDGTGAGTTFPSWITSSLVSAKALLVGANVQPPNVTLPDNAYISAYNSSTRTVTLSQDFQGTIANGSNEVTGVYDAEGTLIGETPGTLIDIPYILPYAPGSIVTANTVQSTSGGNTIVMGQNAQVPTSLSPAPLVPFVVYVGTGSTVRAKGTATINNGSASLTAVIITSGSFASITAGDTVFSSGYIMPLGTSELTVSTSTVVANVAATVSGTGFHCYFINGQNYLSWTPSSVYQYDYSCNLTSGSSTVTITSTPGAGNITAGMVGATASGLESTISGSGIPANAKVLFVDGTNSFSIAVSGVPTNATASGTVTLTAPAYSNVNSTDLPGFTQTELYFPVPGTIAMKFGLWPFTSTDIANYTTSFAENNHTIINTSMEAGHANWQYIILCDACHNNTLQGIRYESAIGGRIRFQDYFQLNGSTPKNYAAYENDIVGGFELAQTQVISGPLSYTNNQHTSQGDVNAVLRSFGDARSNSVSDTLPVISFYSGQVSPYRLNLGTGWLGQIGATYWQGKGASDASYRFQLNAQQGTLQWSNGAGFIGPSLSTDPNGGALYLDNESLNFYGLLTGKTGAAAGWNQPHLVLSGQHIWVNPATQTLMYNSTQPTSASNGLALNASAAFILNSSTSTPIPVTITSLTAGDGLLYNSGGAYFYNGQPWSSGANLASYVQYGAASCNIDGAHVWAPKTNTCIQTPTVGTPTVGQAACIKSAGPPVVIGYCSTVVSSGGACTCN